MRSIPSSEGKPTHTSAVGGTSPGIKIKYAVLMPVEQKGFTKPFQNRI
ncbi:MAG: hypothetical protein QXS81_04135 [Candidatus Micrarchaeaceae archaeon]